MLVTELEVAIDVGRHFDALGIVWLVGGSVASSLLGEPRATADIDLVADLREPKVAELRLRLGDAYYMDEDTARWAVRTRRSFNVIQQATITKVDIFCAKDDPLAREQLARRITIEALGHSIPISSAEDTIVQKLVWFEEGGRGSERQWRDALGVVRVRGNTLERAYLARAAAGYGLSELLAKLLDEAA
jgi:hypothetical protein